MPPEGSLLPTGIVLVVDDDPTVMQVVKLSLEGVGFQVLEAAAVSGVAPDWSRGDRLSIAGFAA